MSLKQKAFELSELKQLSLMWKSLEVPGLSANYLGRLLQPTVNGHILLTFTIDGWLAKELIQRLYGLRPDSFTDKIRPDDNALALGIQIAKVGSVWKEIYLANLSIIHERQEKFIGSICEKTTEDLILEIKSVLSMERKAFGSTLEAQEALLKGRR